MADATVSVGTGFTITFGTSSWTAEIEEITPPGSSRPVIDTSHQTTTTYRTKTPGKLVDNGDLEITGHYYVSLAPPIASVAETITLADVNEASSLDFTGFMHDYKPQGAFDDKMMFSAAIAVSGAIDRDASS